MEFVQVSKEDGIATVALSRGKVNALNEPMIDQINDCFADLENDPRVQAVVLTGKGSFFSFGFDIPEFLTYSKDAFVKFLIKFTNLYSYLFLYPKPVVAALNGHTMAGGCMLASTCDYRVMASGKAKISLNEITFGSSVLAGSVEMLKFCVGSKTAASILYKGAMYSAPEALEAGLIDQVASEEFLATEAEKIAKSLAGREGPAFRSIKGLLRKPVAEEMKKRERDSVLEFVDIWYSEKTWENLKGIKIRT
jgi:3,2-trans-enoyl-CoA isomerase